MVRLSPSCHVRPLGTGRVAAPGPGWTHPPRRSSLAAYSASVLSGKAVTSLKKPPHCRRPVELTVLHSSPRTTRCLLLRFAQGDLARLLSLQAAELLHHLGRIARHEALALVLLGEDLLRQPWPR